jgi:hypothetical protein
LLTGADSEFDADACPGCCQLLGARQASIVAVFFSRANELVWPGAEPAGLEFVEGVEDVSSALAKCER